MKAIYTDDILEEESLRQKLERLHRMQEARETFECNTADADESECLEPELETTDSSDSIVC